MMKCILLLLLSISLSQAVIRYCCSGLTPNVIQSQCLTPANTKCFTLPIGNSSTFTYGCGSDGINYPTTCTTDFCNCPQEAHKTATAVQWFFGEMRKIMYPIMGIIFGIIWIALAFIGGGPTEVILLVVSIVDAIFGIFLIFLPATAYLGLFYVAVGAFSIAVVKHSIGGKAGLYFVIGLTILIFLLTGGLTFISYSNNYFDEVANTITATPSACESSMHIIDWDDAYWNLDTRCENFALFEGFCVFLLFLVQPIALLALFFQMSGGGGGGGHGGHGGHGAGPGSASGHSGAPSGTSGASNA